MQEGRRFLGRRNHDNTEAREWMGAHINSHICVPKDLDLNSDAKLFHRVHLISKTLINSNYNIIYIKMMYWRFDMLVYLSVYEITSKM